MRDEKKQQLSWLEMIKVKAQRLSSMKIILGFDAFVDSVVKVIEHKGVDGSTNYFDSTHAFGQYIVEKGNKSFSIELQEITNKLGGNMPIMANALAQMGPDIHCIGPLGIPDIHPVFRLMSNCHLYSYANPGLSKVLEFNTGKIMLAEMMELNDIPWHYIRDTVGRQKLVELFQGSDLIALLNWSELDNSTAIWEGLLEDVLPGTNALKRPIGFFDLSDCSKRQADPIRQALDMFSHFARYWDVILSLNLNEATILNAVLSGNEKNTGDIRKMCDHIYESLKINTVIIHSAREAVARDMNGMCSQKSFFLKTPAISSGAGDNFNAGFATGKLMEMTTAMSLVLGNATSALYMQSASSPSVSNVTNFLSENLSTWTLSGQPS